MGWFEFRPYVSVAQRRAQAAREVEKRKKKGQAITPIVIEGRTIAQTFWGKSWCENLESYSDFENRLPRGRTYVRNGSVVHLNIGKGTITALVSGSELYNVKITITPLPAAHWRDVKKQCSGQIGTLVELLQGRLSRSVMDVVTQHGSGLFPKPAEIKMSCSCPDWAGMCKHVAAVMYGIGARLDQQPELLFVLRQVDHLELIEEVGSAAGAGTAAPRGKKTLASSELADVFGIELDVEEPVAGTPPPQDAAASGARPPAPAVGKAARKPRKVAGKSQAADEFPSTTSTVESRKAMRTQPVRNAAAIGEAPLPKTATKGSRSRRKRAKP